MSESIPVADETERKEPRWADQVKELVRMTLTTCGSDDSEVERLYSAHEQLWRSAFSSAPYSD